MGYIFGGKAYKRSNNPNRRLAAVIIVSGCILVPLIQMAMIWEYGYTPRYAVDFAWQMIFGVNTLPDYRKHGYAGQLIQCAIKDAREQGRKGLVLTCKEKLIKYYAKFSFVDEGVSDKSTHGNAVWHQMRLTF